MTDLLLPAGVSELRHALLRADNLEWRDSSATGDGSHTLAGHAAVFNQETILYDGAWLRLREKVAPGAFAAVLGRNPDVHLNIGHDMTKAIARTGRSANQVGGLELSEDKRGLRVFARLDPADPDVAALAVKMKRGIIDQMSFAFTVERDERVTVTDEEDREDTLRTILEVRDLYDVTVVAQGAYPQTDASIRSLLRYASEDGRAFGRAGEIIAPTSAGDSAQSSIAPPEGAAELERTLSRARAEATHRLARARQRIAA